MNPQRPDSGETHPGPFAGGAVDPYARPGASMGTQGQPAQAGPGETPGTAMDIGTLTTVIRDVIEGTFPPRLWITGEVSGFKRYKGGQWYFTLRDRTSAIQCVMWSQDVRRMPGPPEEGMAVIALCQVRFYTERGGLQVVVRRMSEVGDGMWRKRFEQTRQRLEADGLLDPSRKRPLPWFPRRIAIITSQDGAALPDIVTVIRKRCPIVELVLIPAVVQGVDAPTSLCRALTRLTKWGGADLVIIGRGGGSREDLWAFNDERLARKLALCPVPTISAVGHQVDVTICDLVADHRAATPSAAAEAAVPVLADVQREVADYAHSLRRQVERLTTRGRERLSWLTQRLHSRAQHAIEARRLKIEGLGGRLHALSPLATLGRGYAAVFDAAGSPITDVKNVNTGDNVRVRLRDGSFGARVESLMPREAP